MKTLMITKDVIEYRKASAEALELQYEYSELIWKPDKDARQREMIEDWLIKQGCRILTDHYPAECVIYLYPDGIGGSEDSCYELHDKSKPITFMKTFMEYIKSKA